ncbi:hypothetical protein [Methylomonas sp. 11b]|uniref:hypothetical protein n=1 Tax=Methylomonas sp. 11b TaxID=1168169 RepID=UPI00047E1B0B|nr:hypothetical protein [Methylomonas sp. 11b]
MTEIYVEYAETTGRLKLYDTPDGYEKRKEYQAVMQVLWISSTMVLLQDAKGELSKRALLKISQKLYDKGIERVQIVRAKGRRMSWGEIIESNDQEDVYLVNLLEMRHRGLINA